jgi:hypothetical protein
MLLANLLKDMGNKHLNLKIVIFLQSFKESKKVNHIFTHKQKHNDH